MTDQPTRLTPARGVWLRVATPTINGALNVQVSVSFNDEHSPPGAGWYYVEEDLEGDQPLPVHDPAWLRTYMAEPEPPQLVAEHTAEAVWDDELGDWVTAPDAGLTQLDHGDEPPNAPVADLLQAELYAKAQEVAARAKQARPLHTVIDTTGEEA